MQSNKSITSNLEHVQVRIMGRRKRDENTLLGLGEVEEIVVPSTVSNVSRRRRSVDCQRAIHRQTVRTTESGVALTHSSVKTWFHTNENQEGNESLPYMFRCHCIHWGKPTVAPSHSTETNSPENQRRQDTWEKNKSLSTLGFFFLLVPCAARGSGIDADRRVHAKMCILQEIRALSRELIHLSIQIAVIRDGARSFVHLKSRFLTRIRQIKMKVLPFP